MQPWCLNVLLCPDYIHIELIICSSSLSTTQSRTHQFAGKLLEFALNFSGSLGGIPPSTTFLGDFGWGRFLANHECQATENHDPLVAQSLAVSPRTISWQQFLNVAQLPLIFVAQLRLAPCNLTPKASMYITYIWWISMGTVGKYTIHED